MKATVVRNGEVVTLEGTPEEIQQFLDKSKQPLPNPKNQKQSVNPKPQWSKEHDEIMDLIRKAQKDVEEVKNKPWPSYWPYYPYRFSFKYCTCPINGWYSITPPPPCPVHGNFEWYTVTWNNTDNKIQYTNYPQNYITIAGGSDNLRIDSCPSTFNTITSQWESGVLND